MLFRVFITKTTICVSKVSTKLLVYPTCSKLKYYASEADSRTGLSFPARVPPPPLSLSLSLSLSASALFSFSKTQIYSFSNFTCKYSRNHSTAIVFILCVAYFILSDNGSIIRIFVQINILEGGACYVVLMGHISITISYSSRCLTTETEKYTIENSFIENLAASKYSMWHREANKFNNK